MHRILQGNRSEDAVSPVVGVMLMLVVTIIIAAVVSGFTGGLVTSAEKAPNTVLDVKIYEQYPNMIMGFLDTYPSFQIKSIGGEPLNTEHMKIKLTWANATTGHEYNRTFSGGTFTASATEYPAMAVMPTDMTNEPLKTSYSYWFGNVTIENGGILQSMGLQSLVAKYPATQLNVTDDQSFEIIFGNDASTGIEQYKTIKKGMPVHVIITYNEYAIVDKEVIVL